MITFSRFSPCVFSILLLLLLKTTRRVCVLRARFLFFYYITMVVVYNIQCFGPSPINLSIRDNWNRFFFFFSRLEESKTLPAHPTIPSPAAPSAFGRATKLLPSLSSPTITSYNTQHWFFTGVIFFPSIIFPVRFFFLPRTSFPVETYYKSYFRRSVYIYIQ